MTLRAREDGAGDAALGMSWTRAALLALGAVAAVVAGILLFTPRASWAHYLSYDVPIAVPFVLFLRERWHGRAAWHGAWRTVDLGVVAVALLRPASIHLGFGALPPFVSGHALFLTYAALATRSPLVRCTAAAVMLQVLYLKVFVWTDPSVFGGAALGILAAVIWRRWERGNHAEDAPLPVDVARL